MSKDPEASSGRASPTKGERRAACLWMRYEDPEAFETDTDEEEDAIRYAWTDEIFTTGVTFRTADDLKKFDIARERAQEYRKMKAEEKKANPKLTVFKDKANRNMEKPVSSKDYPIKDSKRCLGSTPAEARRSRSNSDESNRQTCQPKRGKWMAEEKKKMEKALEDSKKDDGTDLLLIDNVKASTQSTAVSPSAETSCDVDNNSNHENTKFAKKKETQDDVDDDSTDQSWIGTDDAVKNPYTQTLTAETIDDNNNSDSADSVSVSNNNITGTGNNGGGEQYGQPDSDSEDLEPSICEFCRNYVTECEWFEYSNEVGLMNMDLEELHYGVLSFWQIRNEHAARRFAFYRLCDRIRRLGTPEGADDLDYRLRHPFPECVTNRIREMYPDPDDNYTGFLNNPS